MVGNEDLILVVVKLWMSVRAVLGLLASARAAGAAACAALSSLQQYRY
jgi:hypothetical protein